MQKRVNSRISFEITFSAWDPDEAFNKVIPVFAIFIHKTILHHFFRCNFNDGRSKHVVKWEEFKQGTIHLYTFTDKSLWEILVFLILMTTTGTLHELGHGMTLKNFGGEVRQVGFTPVLFDSCLLLRCQ